MQQAAVYIQGTYVMFLRRKESDNMVSSQVLQKTLEELKNITKVDLSILNIDGTVLVSTMPDDQVDHATVRQFVESPADSQILQDRYFLKVFDDNDVEYVLVSSGSMNDPYLVGRVAVCQIQNLIIAYKERLDKNNFIQNLLLDNLLLVDIYNRAKKLRIDTNARRIVFTVETAGDKDNTALDKIKSLFTGRPQDFITAIDENNVIIVNELKEGEDYAEMNRLARLIADTLQTDQSGQIRVAYGNVVEEIKNVSRSYKESQMALEVGKIFHAEKNVIPYNNLGIGRLIYQLPIPLCKMFMKEVFGEQLPDTFDDETLMTINKFFENNLNVSETSRQLYVHRNTLVYRLEKLQKSTGLDIRVFDDALTFKIAMMVVRYMKYMQEQNP